MGLFFYSMPVRALLKYEHCKIGSLCSTVYQHWLVIIVSVLYRYILANSLKDVLRRKANFAYIHILVSCQTDVIGK